MITIDTLLTISFIEYLWNMKIVSLPKILIYA